jgi:hypothetical protein
MTARYRLRGSLVGPDTVGPEQTVLVSMDRLAKESPSPKTLRGRFSLLSISSHTRETSHRERADEGGRQLPVDASPGPDGRLVGPTAAPFRPFAAAPARVSSVSVA